MQTIDITLFMSMKDIKNSGQFELDLSDPQSAIAFNQSAATVHAIKGMPRYWGFASYADKHNQASLIDNKAIVLEYAYAQRQPLIDRLTELGWNALVFNADRPQQATVVVVLPFRQRKPTEKQYTRAATVVADTIGLYDLLDGQSNTFLVQPAEYARAQIVMGKSLGPFEINRDGWMEFKTYCQPKPSTATNEAAYAHARVLLENNPVEQKRTKSQEVAAAFRTIADYFDAEGF